MGTRKLSKLSLFLIVMILVNAAIAEITTESATTDNMTQEQNGNTVTTEAANLDNENEIETTTINAKGSGLAESLQSTTETVTESANNAEDNTTERATESATNAQDNTTEPTTESSNNAEEVTTETSNNNAASTEPSTESSTSKINCLCDCALNGNKVSLDCTTQATQQSQTETTENAEGTTPISSNNNAETTTQAAKQEETTNPSQVEVDTTSPSSNEPELTTIPPPPICNTPGVQANELNCQQYNDCSLEGSQDGNFHLLTKSCPERQAFNIELNRCSRDISSCAALPIQCLIKGGVADPFTNTSFYYCEPRLIGLGFRIFYINCAANEIFYPELGKCYIDFNNLPSENFPLYNWNQVTDLDIVKAELKLLKAQDKLKLKQEKARKKAEEKLLKELEKEAKRKAKLEEKANKEKAKQQASTFSCLQEGNYASDIGEYVYIACVNKKGKLKAVAMQCSFGATFNAETGTCINSAGNVNSSISQEEDDD